MCKTRNKPSTPPVSLHSLKRLHQHIPFDCGYISNEMSFCVVCFYFSEQQYSAGASNDLRWRTREVSPQQPKQTPYTARVSKNQEDQILAELVSTASPPIFPFLPSPPGSCTTLPHFPLHVQSA
ncbi:unnamed protein product, partial [Ectocarpus sp. 8 AP-2014]